MNARRVAMLNSNRPQSRVHPFEREDGGKVVVEMSFERFSRRQDMVLRKGLAWKWLVHK
jgi:hypothetical protein